MVKDAAPAGVWLWTMERSWIWDFSEMGTDADVMSRGTIVQKLFFFALFIRPIGNGNGHSTYNLCKSFITKVLYMANTIG
jgi:hypothetical protein